MRLFFVQAMLKSCPFNEQPQCYTLPDVQATPFHMEEDEGTPIEQIEQRDREPSAKRQRHYAPDPHDLPAAKATGKPVLNTRALRSVLKGGGAGLHQLSASRMDNLLYYITS